MKDDILNQTGEKRILCIMPCYHAYANANNICSLKILERLKESGHQVDILCFDQANLPLYTTEKGYSIITIPNEYIKFVEKYKKAIPLRHGQICQAFIVCCSKVNAI